MLRQRIRNSVKHVSEFAKKKLWLEITDYPSENSVLVLDEMKSECYKYGIRGCRRDGLE